MAMASCWRSSGERGEDREAYGEGECGMHREEDVAECSEQEATALKKAKKQNRAELLGKAREAPSGSFEGNDKYL
ncbi:hypothetical protein HYQ44_016748 [Verticillium longisporum]|nr:hypothetical protein HYQ44_016748 [Verticillium longisporum]